MINNCKMTVLKMWRRKRENRISTSFLSLYRNSNRKIRQMADEPALTRWTFPVNFKCTWLFEFSVLMLMFLTDLFTLLILILILIFEWQLDQRKRLCGVSLRFLLRLICFSFSFTLSLSSTYRILFVFLCLLLIFFCAEHCMEWWLRV